MVAKLSDAEFVERTRANNRRRSERQRQRLMMAGRTALTVWIPDSVRSALTAKAANDGATIADTATALLSAALSQTAPTPSPAVDSLPLFDAAAAHINITSERDQQIATLHGQGLSGYAIAAEVGCSEPTVRRALKRLNQEATE